MTKTIMAFLTIVLVSGSFLAGCTSSSQSKVNEAQNNMRAAGNNLAEAQRSDANAISQQVAQEWRSFEMEMNENIAKNQAEIRELRKKVAAADAKERERLNSALDELEKQTNDSKRKLQEESERIASKVAAQQKEEQQKAAAFQREFKHDMDKLNKAIKDFTKDNVK